MRKVEGIEDLAGCLEPVCGSRTRDRRWSCCLLVTWILGTGVAGAQAVPQLKLGPPAELKAVEFSRIAGLRELADGRVLVTDALEKQLVVVDFARNTSVRIGATGSGPGEYRVPGQLIALPGDTTYVVDAMAGRWLVMKGTSIVGTITMNDPPIKHSSRNPAGIDEKGHVVMTRPARDIGEARGTITTGAADSAWVVRIDGVSGTADTLTKTRIRPSRIAITGAKEIQSVSITMNPLSVGESPVVFPDGSIAIARLDPYRVDWISPADVVTKGRPLPFEPLPVTTAEKVAVMERLQRTDPSASKDPESILDWPATMPPFLASQLNAGSDGRLWIRRTQTTQTRGTVYDVVDRSGRLAARLQLAADQIIGGFGPNRVYIITTDDDGLQHLSRYTLPK